MARPIQGAEAREHARAIAFTRLTADRLASCYRLATVILGDPVEAEDATHDAAVRAWERWGSLRDPDRFDAWFGRANYTATLLTGGRVLIAGGFDGFTNSLALTCYTTPPRVHSAPRDP